MRVRDSCPPCGGRARRDVRGGAAGCRSERSRGVPARVTAKAEDSRSYYPKTRKREDVPKSPYQTPRPLPCAVPLRCLQERYVVPRTMTSHTRSRGVGWKPCTCQDTSTATANIAVPAPIATGSGHRRAPRTPTNIANGKKNTGAQYIADALGMTTTSQGPPMSGGSRPGARCRPQAHLAGVSAGGGARRPRMPSSSSTDTRLAAASHQDPRRAHRRRLDVLRAGRARWCSRAPMPARTATDPRQSEQGFLHPWGVAAAASRRSAR